MLRFYVIAYIKNTERSKFGIPHSIPCCEIHHFRIFCFPDMDDSEWLKRCSVSQKQENCFFEAAPSQLYFNLTDSSFLLNWPLYSMLTVGLIIKIRLTIHVSSIVVYRLIFIKCYLLILLFFKNNKGHMMAIANENETWGVWQVESVNFCTLLLLLSNLRVSYLRNDNYYFLFCIEIKLFEF